MTGHLRRGFSLVEMMITVVVMSIIMAAVGSAVLIASKALPSERDSGMAALNAAEAADQLAADLRYALKLPERAEHAATFTVPDRNGDGGEEEIRYAWSGTSGDPLTRSVNGGPAATLLESVRELSLRYDVLSRELDRQVASDLSEQTVYQHDSSNSLSDYAVEDDHVIGQHFFPSLPADAVRWRPTSVWLRLRYHGAEKGTSAVRFRYADSAGKPDSDVLLEATVLEQSLTESFAWHKVVFSDAPELSAGKGVFVMIEHVDDAHSCDVEYKGGNVSIEGSYMARTGNGGDSWDLEADKAIRVYVVGIPVAENTETYTVQRVGDVGIALRCGEGEDSRVRSSAELINAPQLAD